MRGRCWCRFENEPALHVVQSIECSRLREKVRIGANGWRPGDLKARELHPGEEVEAPALTSRVLITKALARNPHFDLIPALDQPTLRLEEVIRIELNAPL